MMVVLVLGMDETKWKLGFATSGWVVFIVPSHEIWMVV